MEGHKTDSVKHIVGAGGYHKGLISIRISVSALYFSLLSECFLFHRSGVPTSPLRAQSLWPLQVEALEL